MPDALAEGWRIEHDLLGSDAIPRGALYGVHSHRAIVNFERVGAVRVGDVPELVSAFGMVKLAALRANVASGVLHGPLISALEDACAEMINGDERLRAALVVPLLQGGAGTSTNMNVNEVLANRALELLGYQPGTYQHCHPNDHVNRSQSTNDVYPTALRLALAARGERVEGAVERLAAVLRSKGSEYAGMQKLGRTQLQDAVPLSVEDEFGAWADGLSAACQCLSSSRARLYTVNLGGTAIGTGLATPPRYAALSVEALAEISGRPVVAPASRISATIEVSGLLRTSAALRELAVTVAKLANDLQLLSSGPHAGFGELRLPPMQAGSSMMPGKVNPVIPEWVNQLAFRVRGADATVALALDAGQLQLHAMLPVATEELFTAQDAMCAAVGALADRCIAGIVVDPTRASDNAHHSLSELSMVAAADGYAAATELALSARPLTSVGHHDPIPDPRRN